MSDQVEAVGQEGGEFALPLAEVVEEGAEVGQGLVVGVPQCLLLEEPPQPLDEVEVRRIGRQVD